MFRNFYKNVYEQPVSAIGTALVNNAYLPASASFIDTNGYDQVSVFIHLGVIADPMTFSVFQDTSATATGSIKILTGATKTIADTDDGKWLCIEFPVAALDTANSFRYITIKTTDVSGSNYASMVVRMFRAREVPVSQPANYAYSVILGG